MKTHAFLFQPCKDVGTILSCGSGLLALRAPLLATPHPVLQHKTVRELHALTERPTNDNFTKTSREAPRNYDGAKEGHSSSARLAGTLPWLPPSDRSAQREVFPLRPAPGAWKKHVGTAGVCVPDLTQ